MSTGNLYPPQAFTREMLSKAFVWLQTQPESVRELARNSESLIALYLKNQRAQGANQKKMESQTANVNEAQFSDAPVSKQNFMTDLKSLAEGLKQFEDPEAATPAPAQSFQTQSFAAQLRHEIPALPPQPKQQTAPQLNSNSQYMIREVKEKFNLSSDIEALNMLVAIAYKNLKSLID